MSRSNQHPPPITRPVNNNKIYTTSTSRRSKNTSSTSLQPNHPTSCNSLSPIAKLLGNRPTAVESLVTKVEAISFEGIHQSDLHLHSHHQPPQHQSPIRTHRDQDHQAPSILAIFDSDPISSSSIPQLTTPPLSLTHSSPPTDLAQRPPDPHDQFVVRDTPTIRQLKTSLRSRLNFDPNYHPRSSEDPSRSEHQYPLPLPSPPHAHHSPSLSSSPPKGNPDSLPNRQPSLASSSHGSDLSSPTHVPPLARPTSRSSSSSLSSSLNPAAFQFNQFNHQNDPRRPRHTISSSRSHPHPDQVENPAVGLNNSPAGFDQLFSHLGIDSLHPRRSRPPPKNSPPRTPTNLPNLHLPLINIDLSPPALALWTLEAYDCGRKIEFADLMVHLIVLPLHTALAISRKLPGVGHRLDLITPLLHQAEKENQSILLTATQIGFGLVLASGWKVAKRLLS